MSSSKSVLDKEALQSLLDLDTEVGGTLIPELLQTFQVEAPALMNKILQFYSENKMTELARSAHALKSTVGNFGALHLVELLQNLEIYADENNKSEVDAALTHVKSEFALLENELKNFKKAA